MNSPFPGMDPYIEAGGVWGDFHNNLIHDIQRHLAETVPERYVVRSRERTYLVLATEKGQAEDQATPDVEVTRGSVQIPPFEGDRGAMRAFEVNEHHEHFIDVYEAGEEQHPVTVIEMLSPSNKRRNTAGWELYRNKRQSLLLGGGHFVELDLLRGGQKMPMLDAWPRCPYTLLVSRRELAPTCRVWPGWSLKALPTIPIPLLDPDADVPLPLQPLIDALYSRNRYHRSIDYTKPVHPPLDDAEAAFLAEQLRKSSSSA